MNIQPLARYMPPMAGCWQGRDDGPEALRLHQTVELIDLRTKLPASKGICLLGFACDEGIRRNQGRVGAAEGPLAIRQALGKLPHSQKIFDCGNILCEDGDLEKSQESLAGVVQALQNKGFRTLILGGGHETAWPHYLGIAEAHPEKRCSIINFDAHFDLRPIVKDRGTSGTSFLQMQEYLARQQRNFSYTCLGIQPSGNTSSLFEKAEGLNVCYVPAEEYYLKGGERGIECIQSVLLESDSVYVSVCLDVIASAFAPGVSAPQPLGLLPWHVVPALRILAQSGKVQGIDFVEMSPPHDQQGLTARLAANLIYEFLS